MYYLKVEQLGFFLPGQHVKFDNIFAAKINFFSNGILAETSNRNKIFGKNVIYPILSLIFHEHSLYIIFKSDEELETSV